MQIEHEVPAPATADAPAAYAFGPFVLDLSNRVLYRTGLALDMPAKIFEILRCLVLHGDRLVSKEVLVEEVWDGSPIGDNNIAQHMHLVRVVLDDLSKPYRYIATVHGRGYRFIADAQRVTPPERRLPAASNPSMLPQALATELYSNAAFFAKIGTAAALESGAQLCRKALEVYPGFADAHAGIAFDAILKAAFLFGVPSQQFEVARRNAAQALRLDAHCARAHIVMAALAILDEHQPAQAYEHLAAAAATSPDLPEIAILRIVALSAEGKHDEARQAARDALTLLPSSTAVTAYAALASYLSGELDATAAPLERLLIFKPGAAFPSYLLGLTRLAQGQYGAAREIFQALIAGRISLVPAYEKFRQRAIAGLSFIEARTGSPEDARALARDVQRSEHCSYVALALARAGLGEEDSVIACLEEARERRDPWFPLVAHDPVFREYRTLPEFESITILAT
jgi:DNA-binding winged helix-turn-helix (wHTH) protein